MWCGVMNCGVVYMVWCSVHGVAWRGVVYMVWCGVVCTVVCCAVLCCTVVCCVLWCAVLWCGVLYCSVLYCGAVRCCILCCTARGLISYLYNSYNYDFNWYYLQVAVRSKYSDLIRSFKIWFVHTHFHYRPHNPSTGYTNFPLYKNWVSVSSNGTNVWKSLEMFDSECDINALEFPFDKQICYLNFSSETYDSTLLGINLIGKVSYFSKEGMFLWRYTCL